MGPAEQQQQQKRKGDDNNNNDHAEPKRPKIVAGFVVDDDDGDDEDAEDEIRGALADFDSQFDTIQQTHQPQEEEAESQPSRPLLQHSSTTLPGEEEEDSFILPPPPPPPSSFHGIRIKTCTGRTHHIALRRASERISYERLVSNRSATPLPGRAKRSYYGIEIHQLMDEAAKQHTTTTTTTQRQIESVQPSIEQVVPISNNKSKKSSAMWTEKYRAGKFTDLIGDERTHRAVLRWLKGWDPIVFPNLARTRRQQNQKTKGHGGDDNDGLRLQRKVLLVCGPPGLGKTTLAHVCARQAGYEVLEINASDERSRDVVKNRIRDSLGTENVKGANVEVGAAKRRKAGRPICVVVDEVDGVVSGSSGSGEGGFMKALIDLVLLDQKNAAGAGETTKKRSKKGDNFRFLRPLILVCNDVYHPSLRPLRASRVAEIVHARQAPMESVAQRVRHIFNREGIACDSDAARRLCEASWGVLGKRQTRSKSSGTGEGDIRSVLVNAEWVAHKLRNEHGASSSPKLTKNWLEQNIVKGSLSKGIGRGGVHEIVDRVFTEGAGFPETPIGLDPVHETSRGRGRGDELLDNSNGSLGGVGDMKKRNAATKLREMVDSSGDHDRCVTECFSAYPIQSFQDDTFLSKPNAAYDWLQFHDAMSSKVFHTQDWELAGYLSQAVLAFHQLFASPGGRQSSAPGSIIQKGNAEEEEEKEEEEEEHPFSGVKADYAAFEAQKQNNAIVTGFQSSFSPPIIRLFRSTDSIATELVPNLMRILSPNVKPVVIRGSKEQGNVASVRKESERALVRMAVRAMIGMGVIFEKVRVENEGSYGGWAYRMEP